MNSRDIQFNTNREKARKKRTKIILLFFLINLVVIALIVAFLRKPFFFVQETIIHGIETIDEVAVHEKINSYFSGMILYVIPKKNIITFSKKSFTRYMLNEFRSFESVHLEFDQQKKLIVTVTERAPRYLLCYQDECFFVSYDGIIYKKAPHFSEGVFIKIYTELPISDLIIGRNIREFILDYDRFTFLVDMFLKNETSVIKVVYKEIPVIQFFINTFKNIPVISSAHVLTRHSINPNELNNLLNLLASDIIFLETLQKQGNVLEYIDLTIPDKIYYKFKNNNTNQ